MTSRSGGSSAVFAAALGGFMVGAGLTFAATYCFWAQPSKTTVRDPEKNNVFSSSQQRSAYAAASSVERSESFLADLLASLWKQINIMATEKIQRTVAPIFQTLPGPLASLRFTKVCLGHVPLRLDNIVVHECTKNSFGRDYVQFDVDVVWDGECDIQLQADYIGCFGVKSIKLFGRMSVVLQPLTNALPIVGAVQFAFINTPDLELDFTGIAQVADIKSINTSIRSCILTSIEGIMVLPNRSTIKIDEVQSFLDIYQPPLGVARITLQQGSGFQVESRFLREADVPDLYCNIQVAGGEIWKTALVENSLTPVWNESADFLVFDYDQIVRFDAMDNDDGIFDINDSVGTAHATFGELLLSGKVQDVVLCKDGKATGAHVTVKCDLLPLVDDLSCFETPHTQLAGTDKTICGLLTIVVSRAFDLPVQEDQKGKAKPDSYVTVAFSGTEFVALAVNGGTSPSYDCEFRVPINPAMLSKVGGEVDKLPPVMFTITQGAPGSNSIHRYGTVEVSCASIAHSPGYTVSGRQQIGDLGASLEVSVSLRGVQSRCDKAGSSDTIAVAYPTLSDLPFSVAVDDNDVGSLVRITVVKGWGFEIEKRRLRKSDIPDIYCKIKYGSSLTAWRTATVQNSLAPVWNESKAFTMMNHAQTLQINVFDEDTGRHDADDELGNARISVGKLLLAGGTFDVEIMSGGKSMGSFITLRCEILAPSTSKDKAYKSTSSSLTMTACAERSPRTTSWADINAPTDQGNVCWN